MHKNLKIFISELVGTLIITLVAYLSVLQPSYKVIFSIVLGVVFCLCYYFGHKFASVAQFNPLVSVASVINKRITVKDFFIILLAQLIAIAGGAAILIASNQEVFAQSLDSLNENSIYLSIPTSIFILLGSYIYFFGAIITKKNGSLKTFSGFFLGALLTLICIFEPTLIKMLVINPFVSLIIFIYNLMRDVVTQTELVNTIIYMAIPFVGLGGALLTDYLYIKNKKKAE